MGKKIELASHNRNLTYEWEPIPEDSPLRTRFSHIYMAYVSEKADPETDLQCQVPECDKKAWSTHRENPLKLMDLSGSVVEISDLDQETRDLTLATRQKIASICKGDLLKRFLDSKTKKN